MPNADVWLPGGISVHAPWESLQYAAREGTMVFAGHQVRVRFARWPRYTFTFNVMSDTVAHLSLARGRGLIDGGATAARFEIDLGDSP